MRRTLLLLPAVLLAGGCGGPAQPSAGEGLVAAAPPVATPAATAVVASPPEAAVPGGAAAAPMLPGTAAPGAAPAPPAAATASPQPAATASPQPAAASPQAARTPGVDAPPPAAAAPGAARTAPPAPGRWTTARVTARVALRETPGGRRAGWIGRRTSFGSPRVVGVLAARGAWLRVLVPERPNDRPAWIRADRADLAATDVSVHVDLSARRLLVRRGGRVVTRIPVGVGAPAHPTPTGRYAVTDKLRMGGPGTTYGCCALALTGHQPAVPEGWAGSDRLAVHGTYAPESIGLATSLGCMRASDGDMRRLLRLVPLGAPVFVRA